MTKRKWILVGWLLLFLTTVGLFVYASNVKSKKRCKGIQVSILGKKEYVFVDIDQIKSIVKANGGREGLPMNEIPLQKIEQELYKDVWIKKVDIYFDNNAVLQVDIDQRDPLARIFTVSGSSFYIDSAKNDLPVNSKVTARVPVFTSFPGKGRYEDSLLLCDIKKISAFITADTFWNAMVTQIDIVDKNRFEIIPIVGNQVIAIGNADSLANKFNRLYSFYRQVWVKKGLNKYERIDVSYNGQVVATKRGVDSSSSTVHVIATDSTHKKADSIQRSRVTTVVQSNVKREVRIPVKQNPIKRVDKKSAAQAKKQTKKS